MDYQRRKVNKGPEILIVEDSPTQAEQLKHLLEEQGYSVRRAANGKEALAAVGQRKPTLIITDVLMPGMDGFTLCKEIKSRGELNDVPVVLMTSLSSPQDVMKGLACGADNFIRKPYEEKYLLKRIEFILANREFRKNEMTRFGLEIYFRGEKHYITSERQQILDMLISTYEDAVSLNEQLQAEQRKLAHSNQVLHVLYRIAERLNRCSSQKEILETSLEGALELPGVEAGWIFLREGENGVRLAASRGLPPALQAAATMEGDCLCLRKLLSGELGSVTNIVECERLQKAAADAGDLLYHASIPIRQGKRATGVMNLAGTDQRLFGEDDLNAMDGVGHQIASALERAELLERLEARVEERTAALKAEIAERESLQKQLVQAQKMEAIGRLAGGVAHDFNNLLTIITGYSDLLLEQVKSGSPIRGQMEEIRRAADRAAALTRQLLAFGRRQVLAPQVLNLNKIVANMDKMLRRLIGEDLDLVTKLDPALSQTKVDPSQVEQVIMNLAVNSRDAMPEGGKLMIETANAELDANYARRHAMAAPGRFVMLAVSDTGCGMDAETQSRIFEPFFTTKETGKGTGLGLATVYGIVKQIGGEIWVYSEPGRGTTFKVYFPQVEGPERAVQTPKVVSASQRGSETILVVEDEEAVRSLVRRVLESKGYAVLTASTAEEAARLCEQQEGKISLLLTDVVMPGMSGRKLAHHLGFSRPEMKVLYMSGYTDNAIVHQGVLDPGTAFLQKPFTPDAVLRKVREVLDTP
ncbi:MAG: response regulator [Acidobacteria bacterium]|nr:response regulator [Acidobacteriota bacterium]